MYLPQQLSYGTHPSQFIHLYTSASPKCLIIILHGGFWKSLYGINPPTAAIESLPSFLLSHNFSVALIEYRRSQDNLWGWPYTNEDVLNACRLIFQQHNDKLPTFLVGHSAGGTLALWLAAQKLFPFAIVYALAPVADLRMAVELKLSDEGDAVQKYMHGTPDQVLDDYRRACPAMLADRLVGENVVFVVGGKDCDIPKQVVLSCYERIVEDERKTSSSQSNVVFKEFEHADHYELVNSNSATWNWISADITNYIARQQG